MARIFSVLALFSFAIAPAVAQDMPLSQILIDGEGWKKVGAPGDKPQTLPVTRTPTVATYSPDRGTIFVVVPGERFLWAAATHPNGAPVALPKPYAPLRLPRGEKSIAVLSLGTDKDGRIYAATNLGVQVFDPTGRLCGVLTPAAEGVPEHMVFEGDKLTLWIGATKYTRKLNTSGAK